MAGGEEQDGFSGYFRGNPRGNGALGRTGGGWIGNSILILVIPLPVARLLSPLVALPEPVRTGVIIALYGLVSAFIQPLAGIIVDGTDRPRPHSCEYRAIHHRRDIH